MNKDKLEYIVHHHLEKLKYPKHPLTYEILPEDKTILHMSYDAKTTLIYFKPKSIVQMIYLCIEDSPSNVTSNLSFMEKLYRVLTDLETEISNKEYADRLQVTIVDPIPDRTTPTFLEKILNKKGKTNDRKL